MVRIVLSAIALSMISAGAAMAQQPVIPATPAVQTAAAAPAKVRCKRYIQTGSLARETKICHTEAEWRQLAEEGRNSARSIVDSSNSAGGLRN